MVLKIPQNPQNISPLLEWTIHDRSFHPVVCWKNALISFLRFIVQRYFKRKRMRSFYTLFYIQDQLLKIYYPYILSLRLQRVVAKVMGRTLLAEGSSYFPLTKSEENFEQDIQYLKKNGGIVLKAPRLNGNQVIERGALLLAFTELFLTFRRCVDVAAVLRHYTLILEPSWSGCTNHNILYFTRFKDQPIIVMAPEKRDYVFLEALGTNLVPVSFGCCDWVNPSIFRPLKDQGKRYDAVMIARWGIYKRHHVLFRALRELRDPSFRVALVADPWPYKRKEIERLIDFYDVRKNLDIFENLKSEEVNEIMNQSKVNLLLSLQEGGNRALFEGFFAGVPGLALKNNIGIPKDYFTPQTGKLIKENNLKSELLYFRNHWTDFNPRAWAEANITPEITTAKLNQLLKRLAYQRGEEWTQDLVAKCNCPKLAYYPDESVGRGLPSIGDILRQYSRSTQDS
jgi:glycosyltransferase involved in cell wall biosynthesis